MAIRSATLTVLLLALAVRAAHGAATCPSAGSSSSISCYGGATFSGTLPSGGLCTCKCGASASVADYDYSGGSGSSNSDSTQFLAASSAACSNALCTTKFPNGCTASAYVNASYATTAQVVAAAAPKSAAVGTGVICVTFTQTCTVAAPCRSYLTTGTLVTYAAMAGDGGVTAPAQCAMNMAALNTAGYVWNTLCTTNNCNAPPSTSDAFATRTAPALATALVAAAVACL
jgi:hypothetical protein